jgi:hypothetical protein
MTAPHLWEAFDRLTADDINTLSLFKGCIVDRTSLLTTTTSTFALLQYQAADIYDPDALHNPSSFSERLVVPADWPAGIWELAISGIWAAHSGGARMFAYDVNGADAGAPVGLKQGAVHASTALALPARPGPFYIPLDPGDYVETYAYQTSGGNLNLSSARTVFRFLGRTV